MCATPRPSTRPSRRAVFDAVVHFAALKAVSESVEKPLDYFRREYRRAYDAAARDGPPMTAAGSCFLLRPPSTACRMKHRRPRPAAFRGMNPYGQTKIMGEQMLNWLSASDPRWAIGVLRYFNPAGAHGSAMIGEDPRDIPNNLMPYISKVATGELPKISVFGRRLRHARRHRRSRLHPCGGPRARPCPVAGTALRERARGIWSTSAPGAGYSVLEVIAAYKRASNRDLAYEIAPRRPGDVPIYVAAAGRAADVFWAFRTEKTARRDVRQFLGLDLRGPAFGGGTD